MASLKDTVTLTAQLNELTSQLHGELTDGDVDFEKLVQLADEISEHADGLAAAFSRVNDALTEPLEQESSSNGSDSSQSGNGGQARAAVRRGAGRARSGTSRRTKSASGSRS